MSNIILYNIFDRYSYSMLELNKILSSCQIHSSKKDSDVLIEITSDQIYNIISRYYPEYRKYYKNNHDSRYANILPTLLQQYSDIIFCRDIKDICFLGDLNNKIQFCFTDKIEFEIENNIVTLIPRYIFEIQFNLISKENNMMSRSYYNHKIYDKSSSSKDLFSHSVIYRLYKLEENNYIEKYNINSEAEMYDRIKEIIDQGYLPVKNIRVIIDVSNKLYTIEEYKDVNIAHTLKSKYQDYFNTTYKQNIFDHYYNVKNNLLSKYKFIRKKSNIGFITNADNNILQYAKMKLIRN